ncbi:MAG: hypothetical protein JXA57_13595 [Armatimonadetes bacterium]|nr:hypothetical protein [Armatimonadota bacterium]
MIAVLDAGTAVEVILRRSRADGGQTNTPGLLQDAMNLADKLVPAQD